MKLDTDDMDTIVAYVIFDVQNRSGIKHIYHLSKLRQMYMEKSITIATQELARIQIDSLYWK